MEEKKFNFEKGMKELEDIVDRMEKNEISLEESVVEFQKGIDLTVKLQKKLDEVEGKIRKLVKNSEGDFEPADD